MLHMFDLFRSGFLDMLAESRFVWAFVGFPHKGAAFDEPLNWAA